MPMKPSYKITSILLLACLCVLSAMVCVSVGTVSYTIPEVVQGLINADSPSRLIICPPAPDTLRRHGGRLFAAGWMYPPGSD